MVFIYDKSFLSEKSILNLVESKSKEKTFPVEKFLL